MCRDRNKLQFVKSKNGQSRKNPEPSWSKRYGEKHRYERIQTFPSGIGPLKKVRLYARNGHYVLQWWDPRTKKSQSQRVDGDLVDAIQAGRRIDEQLEHFRHAGGSRRRITPDELVERFLGDLQGRADAGYLSLSTVERYKSALAHFQAFLAQPAVTKTCPLASRADRDLALRFAQFLSNRQVSPNGCRGATKRPLRGQDFVLDVVRAMYEWANDPARGNCLPAGFCNPFRKATLARRRPAAHQLGEPDITLTMARSFLAACDDYQLALFAPSVLYGLRASETIYIMREHRRGDWLGVKCLPKLAYMTKGVRDKQLPTLTALARLWDEVLGATTTGLLFVRRPVWEQREKPALAGRSLQELEDEFVSRCEQQSVTTAAGKLRVRDQVIRAAGGLTYDYVDGEFRHIAHQLDWPPEATLKDFRHLFATTMANGGLPEHERRYLMGHAAGRDAITNYTHLNQLRAHYADVVTSEYAEILELIEQRANPPRRRSA